MQCENCNIEHTGNYGSGRFCESKCARSFSAKVNREETNKKVSKTLRDRYGKGPFKATCVGCNKVYFARRPTQKFHDIACCRKNKVLNVEALRQAGLKSARIQAEKRRSLNEKEFFELCKSRFDDSLANVSMFDGWDADVIIPSLKCAILWNGKWHYEKITKKHSVKQVQNRDRIKLEKITEANYTAYVIKDLGKQNSEFVQLQFNKFLEFLRDREVVSQ